jgi:hypothetical protein
VKQYPKIKILKSIPFNYLKVYLLITYESLFATSRSVVAGRASSKKYYLEQEERGGVSFLFCPWLRACVIIINGGSCG